MKRTGQCGEHASDAVHRNLFTRGRWGAPKPSFMKPQTSIRAVLLCPRKSGHDHLLGVGKKIEHHVGGGAGAPGVPLPYDRERA